MIVELHIRGSIHSEGVEENPYYEKNTTVNVGFIRGLRPRYAWTKTFVFLLTLDHESTDRCFLLQNYGNPWKRNNMVAVHPSPEHLSVQDTRRRAGALSSQR